MYQQKIDWYNVTLRRCRICLSTNQDHNISDSSCYVKVFNQLVTDNAFLGETDFRKIWLCMWCKSTLKKFLALRALAKASEKILFSHNKILSLPVMLEQKHHIPTMSPITYLHIPSLCTDTENAISDERKNGSVNVDRQFENLNNKQNLSIVYEITEEFVDYVDDEIRVKNENDLEIASNCQSGLNVNETKLCNKENIIILNKVNTIINKSKRKKHIKINSKRKKTRLMEENFKLPKSKIKVLPQQNKRTLRLDELKFDVKYLSLEEQLKEKETKKMKYKDMKYQCDFCGIGFLTSEYLEEHIIRHTKAAGIHKCDICELHFKTSALLSHHRLSHKRLFVCRICGTVISKWSNCFVHRYKCGASVTYVECHVCSKIYSDEHSLKVHMRVHNTGKRYECEHCSKIFKTKQRMIVHIRTHTGQKPFVCEHCAKSFTTNSNLKAHYLVHSNETKHYCVECDTHYKTAKSLKRHLNESVRHTRDRPQLFRCKECPKDFSTMKMLNLHSTRHSEGDNVKCSQCSKIFSNKSNLRKHLKCVHKNVTTTV